MIGINHDIESPDDFSELSDVEQRSHVVGTIKKYGKERARTRLKDRLNVELGQVYVGKPHPEIRAVFMTAIGPNGELIESPPL